MLRKRLRRFRHNLQHRIALMRLARLRRRMYANPPRTTGIERCGPYQVRINDPRNFYVQYKDEFVNRIYHFECSRPRPRIIDGGSNTGMSILYFKQAYPNAEIIGFEPDPAIYPVLRENIECNGLRNVTLIQAGLGDTIGTSAFAPDGAAGGQLHTSGQRHVTVQVRRLSQYLNQPVDFLKLNIEGAERQVLEEAAQRRVLRNVDQMVIEYHGWPGADQHLGAILSLLNAQGFRYLIHDFDRETGAATKPPFRLRPEANWFCLIYAKRIDQAAARQAA